MQFVGDVSYGVYLWHLPVASAVDGFSGGVRGVLTVILSIALATLSFVTVERWAKRGRVPQTLSTLNLAR